MAPAVATTRETASQPADGAGRPANQPAGWEPALEAQSSREQVSCAAVGRESSRRRDSRAGLGGSETEPDIGNEERLVIGICRFLQLRELGTRTW